MSEPETSKEDLDESIASLELTIQRHLDDMESLKVELEASWQRIAHLERERDEADRRAEAKYRAMTTPPHRTSECEHFTAWQGAHERAAALQRQADEDRAAIRDADDILDAVANYTNGGSLQAVLDTCQRFATNTSAIQRAMNPAQEQP